MDKTPGSASKMIRGCFRQTLIGAVTVVVLLTALELILRLYGFGDPILYVNDPVVGYYPAPNQNITRRGRKVITNRFGMRAPDYPAEKKPGNFRILMLGDSTLWGGTLLDQEQIYPRILEKSLNRNLGGKKVEIMNMGVNSWGPFHMLRYVMKFGVFDSDLVIICAPKIDIHRGCYEIVRLPFFCVGRPPRLALEEIFLHLFLRYRMRLINRPSPQSMEHRSRMGMKTFVKLAAYLEKAGCEVFVEILPSRTAGTSDTVPSGERKKVDQLRRLLEAGGYSTGFPAGLFKGKGKLDELYFDECHPNWKAHRIFAEYLKDRIVGHGKQFREWANKPPGDINKN